jgi:hypothetical protein
MIGRRLLVTVAIGLIALSLSAASAAASGWRYVVTSVNGTATWQYSGLTRSGIDTVAFRGRVRPGAPLATASSLLRGRITYTDQNSSGCGPITHTRSRLLRGPNFSMEQSSVMVSWNFPLPDQSLCSDPMGTSVPRMLQTLMSQRMPLSRFTCERMLLNLGGQSQLAQAGILGKLTYHAAVIIKRV